MLFLTFLLVVVKTFQCIDCIGEVNPQKKLTGHKVKELTVVYINPIGKYRHSYVCQ